MRRLVPTAALAAGLGAIGWPAVIQAQTAAIDPHSPAMETAARAALPRARILPITGRVSPLRGVSSMTAGKVTAIHDLASELRAAGLLVSETAAGLRVTIPENVLFDFDHADLRADAAAKLQVLAGGVAKVPDLPVRVEGHTDSKGGEAYNKRLSEARARTVSAWLSAHGVAAGRLSAAGFGAGRPVAPNATPDGRDDPAGRQKNRRVEIVVGAHDAP